MRFIVSRDYSPYSDNCALKGAHLLSPPAVGLISKTQVFRRFVSAIAAMLLASCATQAQIEAAGIANTARELQSKFLVCRSKIDAKPQYAFLYRKLGIATSPRSHA